MKDSVILGTGNSRYLKSVENFKTMYPTYDDFAAALVAGTLPVDFNGINTEGFQQIGDGLGKNTLLKDATAALLGGDASMLPDEALSALIQVVNNNYSELSSLANSKAKIATGSYTGTGVSNASNPKTINFGIDAKFLLIFSVTTQSGSNTQTFIRGIINVSAFKTLVKGAITNQGTPYPSTGANTAGWTCRHSNDSDDLRSISMIGYGGSGYNADYQYNSSGVLYYWVAIG